MNYSGEFANIFNGVNLGIDAQFNSPNYAVNFFGLGNSTLNPEAEDSDNFDLDYNRVKIRTFRGALSLVFRGQQGSVLSYHHFMRATKLIEQKVGLLLC